MDHAEAHERIADLVLEPRALRAFGDDQSAAAVALRSHIERCDECLTEIDAWRRTHAIVLSTLDEGAAGESGLASSFADAPLRPPASMRTAIAAIPASQPRPDGAAPHDARTGSARRHASWRRLPALAAAAMLVVAIGAGAIAVDQSRRADTQRRYAAELAELSASVDRLLQDPGHASTVLVDGAGLPAGSATWSAEEAVVLSTALARPAPGFEYRCWVERDGKRSPIGVMQVGGGIAYWWSDLSADSELLRGGGHIGVSLEAEDGPGGSDPVLVGQLPA